MEFLFGAIAAVLVFIVWRLICIQYGQWRLDLLKDSRDFTENAVTMRYHTRLLDELQADSKRLDQVTCDSAEEIRRLETRRMEQGRTIDNLTAEVGGLNVRLGNLEMGPKDYEKASYEDHGEELRFEWVEKKPKRARRRRRK